mgnify:FL=1
MCLSEPTFRNLLKDLGIFFGTVVAFVLGFLAVSYLLPPSQNPYGFWFGFLFYIYLSSRLLRWLMNRRRSVER